MHFRRNDNKSRKNFKSGLSCLSDARGAEALATLRAMQVPARPDVYQMARVLRNVKKLGQEGEDHINVSSRSTTDIGRIFSLEDNLPYNDSVLQCRVESLRVFAFFLRTGMKEPRLLVPHALPFGVKFDTNHAPNSYLLQAHALWEKLKNYNELQELLTSVSVPLDWYLFNENGERIRTATGTAYAAALMVIQKALRDGEAPDFTMFCPQNLHESLNAMSREDRLVEIQRLIEADLGPVREALVNFKAAQAADRATRDQNRPQKAAFRPNKPKKEAQPKSKYFKKEKAGKPPVMASLNHVLPTVHDVQQAPVEQAPTEAPQPVKDQGVQLQAAGGEVELPANAFAGATLTLVAQVAEKAGDDAQREPVAVNA